MNTPTRESVSLIESKSQFVSAAGIGVDVTREKYPAFISSHLTGTRPSSVSVTKQRGQTFETTTTTTADESLLFKHVNTTTTTSPDEFLPFRQLIATTNPFYSTTESLGDHMSTPKTTVMTGHIPMVSQGHVNEFEGGLLRDVATNTTGF